MKNHTFDQSINDLKGKGAIITLDQPIKNSKNEIVQHPMTINLKKANEIGNKSLGKIDFLRKKHGFSVKLKTKTA